MAKQKALNKVLVTIVTSIIAHSLSAVKAGKDRLTWLKTFKTIETVVEHLNNILTRGSWLDDSEEKLNDEEKTQLEVQRKQSLKRSMCTQAKKAGFTVTENGEDVPYGLYIHNDAFHSASLAKIKDMEAITRTKKNKKNNKKVVDAFIQAGGTLPDTVTTIKSLLDALPSIEGTVNAKDGLFLFNWLSSKIDTSDIDKFMKSVIGYAKKENAPVTEDEQKKIDAQKTLDEMAENLARFQAKVANM